MLPQSWAMRFGVGRGAILFLVFAICCKSAFCQEGLAPAVLQLVKDASVFMKVKTGPIEATGSGFVMKGEGNTIYVVTNEHVVAKPQIDGNELPPGTRLINRLAIRQINAALREATSEVTVVLRSGTPEEQALKGEVVAADTTNDVAIVKVTGVAKMPNAIALDDVGVTLTETMPVFVFGFPFGGALGVGDANPAITVGKGAVSSIRKDDKGALVKVQIDGAVNPGNSGGAVVDANGKLVGVAVATIRGSGIGFAIPPSVAKNALEVRAGRAQAS